MYTHVYTHMYTHTHTHYKFNRRLNDVNLKVIFKAPDNDVTHYITTKRRHPKVSNNTIKNLGAHFKGQSPRFYIVPSETG